METESTEVAVRGPGDPLTRPPWADPYFLDNMDYSSYFEVTGSTNDDRPSCEAYIRSKPFEATQLLQSLYNQRRPRGTNYALWLLTRCLADYFKFGNNEDPAYYMSEDTYNELVLEPGHLTELCLFMVALDDRTPFFEEHPIWIHNVLDLLNGIMTLYYLRHQDRFAEEIDSPTMRIIRKMGCTLWKPLWENRWLFTDGNRQEEFSPDAGKELRVALCNLVLNFYRLLRESDAALRKGISKRDFNEFRDHGFEDLRRLALFCWMHRSRTEPGKAWPVEFEELYHDATLAFLRSLPDEKRAFVHDDVVSTYGARAFLERATETLRRPDMTGVMLSNFVNKLDLFLEDIPSFAPHLVESGLLQALRAAVELQMPLEKDEEVKAYLMNNALLFYVFVASKCPPFEAASTIIRHCNVMKLLSIMIMLAFATNTTALPGDKPRSLSLATSDTIMTGTILTLQTFVELAHDIVAHSTAGGGPNGRKSGLHITLRDALKAEWFPTYASLIKTIPEGEETPRQTHLKHVWKRFGEVVGLDLEREYAEVKRDARRKETCCAWKNCQWHRLPPPNPPRVCKGCGDVRYCSKTCQTDDWRAGHKKDCRRLK
ncbi:hypothetical protein PENSPDRAFT_755782 [Peniophora sp. CONT]|nr:hypothetical protein PENSPDRAFT_755782 [Peniophora sp. CONT]